MDLKKILLGSFIFCNFSLNVYSQNKLNIYGDFVNFLGIQPAVGNIEIDKNRINSSFLMGSYRVDLNQVNDSVYQEITTKKFPFKRSKEVFSYVKRGEKYHLFSYDVPYGVKRKEKDSLFKEKKSFDEKIKNPLDLVSDLRFDRTKDSIHFFLMGCEYSLPIIKNKEGSKINYSCDLSNLVDSSGEEEVIFDSNVKVLVNKNSFENFSTIFRVGENQNYKKIEGRKVR